MLENQKLTFSLNGCKDESSAFINVVSLLVELQSGLVLGVVDVHFGSGDLPQQGIGWHTELHIETLNVFKDLVIIDYNGAGLGVLSLVKLDLLGWWGVERN